MNRWKGPGYKAGQTLACKVLAAEPGGYAVIIPKDNLRGFLPTEARLKIGEEVLAQYVCVHNNRILLSARMAGAQAQASSAPRKPTQDWAQMAASGVHNAVSPEQTQQNYNPAQSGSYPQQGQDMANMNEAERAFLVYAQGKPMNIRLRRAIDLILPPLDKNQQPNKMRIGQGEDLIWLITDLEGGMRTGCVKAFCEPRKSRAAVLLYKGRAVGCIYGNKQLRDPLPTESSLQMMLSDCQTPDTHLVMYGLPEEVTLAMSALFLGYPVERSDDLDARSYMDYIMSWFQQKEQTACLAFSLPASGATLLAFVHKGQFVGSFYVETQEFSRDIEFVYNLIRQDPQSRVEASILPPELTSTSVRLGFSLSMNMPKT
ncbi:MAG: hypothetical protein K2X27_06220 [Candidatus Obscuribacterales bacterium]|nr:hypothetical protein [Candidatus Obscuribacterales bacterium]